MAFYTPHEWHRNPIIMALIFSILYIYTIVCSSACKKKCTHEKKVWNLLEEEVLYKAERGHCIATICKK